MDALRTEETSTTVIYTLSGPNIPYVEVSKAMMWATQEFENHNKSKPFDDSILVRAWDDDIQIYWVKT